MTKPKNRMVVRNRKAHRTVVTREKLHSILVAERYTVETKDACIKAANKEVNNGNVNSAFMHAFAWQ
jgi:hypothetical protein